MQPAQPYQLPYHIYILAYAWSVVNVDVKKRLKLKSQGRDGRIEPTFSEKITGALCILIFACNSLFKFQQNTLIFMFNPCHVAIIFLGIACLRSYGVIGEISAMCVYSFAFGGYIGIIFNENEELS